MIPRRQDKGVEVEVEVQAAAPPAAQAEQGMRTEIGTVIEEIGIETGIGIETATEIETGTGIDISVLDHDQAKGIDRDAMIEAEVVNDGVMMTATATGSELALRDRAAGRRRINSPLKRRLPGTSRPAPPTPSCLFSDP